MLFQTLPINTSSKKCEHDWLFILNVNWKGDDMSIRDDFPILKREVNGFPLIYLDNAATTQKPQIVLDAMSNFYFE